MARHVVKKKRSGARLALASLAVLGLSATATTAAFTDSAQTSATVAAGTADVVINDVVADTGIALGFTSKPNGLSTWNESKDIKVQNAGTLPLVITATTTATGTLAPQLTAEFTTKAATPGVTVAGSPSAAGTSLSGAATLPTVAIAAAKAYKIPAGTTDTITLKLTTPGGLPDTAQGTTATFTVTFNAETY